MKIAAVVLISSLVLPFAARAEQVQSSYISTNSSCGDHHAIFDRTSYTLPLGPQCCGDQLRCTQLLSTMQIDRTPRPPRT